MTAFVRRLLALGLGALCATAAVAMALVLAGWLPAWSWHWGGLALSVEPHQDALWVWVAGVAVSTASGLALCLVAIVPDGRRGPRVLVISPPDDDTLVVSLNARTMHSLLAHEARAIEGVRDVRSRVARDTEGWNVRCMVAVGRGTVLSEVSRALADRVRTALLAHTGVPVSQLAVDLTFASREARRAVR